MWYDTGTDEPPESLSRRAPGEALGPLTRERLQSRLERHLPGKAMEPVRRAILLDADAYGAFLIERHARPPEHYWGPERGEDGSGAA